MNVKAHEMIEEDEIYSINIDLHRFYGECRQGFDFSENFGPKILLEKNLTRNRPENFLMTIFGSGLYLAYRVRGARNDYQSMP